MLFSLPGNHLKISDTDFIWRLVNFLTRKKKQNKNNTHINEQRTKTNKQTNRKHAQLNNKYACNYHQIIMRCVLIKAIAGVMQKTCCATSCSFRISNLLNFDLCGFSNSIANGRPKRTSCTQVNKVTQHGQEETVNMCSHLWVQGHCR